STPRHSEKELQRELYAITTAMACGFSEVASDNSPSLEGRCHHFVGGENAKLLVTDVKLHTEAVSKASEHEDRGKVLPTLEPSHNGLLHSQLGRQLLLGQLVVRPVFHHTDCHLASDPRA